MSLVLVIAGLVACVVLSAFFSASEMAYSSCNSMRLEHLRDSGSQRAGAAVKITEHFDDAPSAIGGNVYYEYDAAGNCRRTLGWQLAENK